MSLICARNLSYALGDKKLLVDANFVISKKDRITLVGRNGAGKSTLLKILCGELPIDSGELELQPGLIVKRLSQEIPKSDGDVYEVVSDSLGEQAQLIKRYHLLCELVGVDPSVADEFQRVQEQIDQQHAWGLHTRIETILDKFNLNGKIKFNDLSGGMKRRVLFAQALVCEPDVLLLDEPTNHLDIESIIWLEKTVEQLNCAVVIVSHDRQFMSNLTRRIFDLDRGVLSDWQGTYEEYLVKKTQSLHEESVANALFDKRLSEEEKWIRQGIKARRTRNEGRVRALKKMRETYKNRVNLTGSMNAKIQHANKSGKEVIIAENICFSYPDKPIANHFTLEVLRGDKIAFVGPNGSGKTTLVNLLLKKIAIEQGKISQGCNLEIAYFDQLRSTLDGNQTVKENVGGGRDKVTVDGKEKHIISYLKDFLFSADTANSKIAGLSGGECNRLLLAKLFLIPSNVLILDEPTNDLDIETLELLEELLSDYKGTVLIISHDRSFINAIASNIVGFVKPGEWVNVAGNYDDWFSYQSSLVVPLAKEPVKPLKVNKTVPSKSKDVLSRNEKRELLNLPKEIDKLESDIAEITKLMSEPDFYHSADSLIKDKNNELLKLQDTLNTLYDRWQFLEGKVE